MKITESQLKLLIKNIILESIDKKVSENIEPVIQKTPNQNHEFDAGRNSVMKAVNVGENIQKEISLSSLFKGKKKEPKFNMSHVHATINHAMEKASGDKVKAISMLTNAMNSSQADLRDVYMTAIHYIRKGNINTSNRKDADFIGEKVGHDGKYQDDMESGMAVKKIHGLKEESGTGAVGGYSTPFAFSKNKLGSGRAIAAAKKYGKVVKSISEKGQK